MAETMETIQKILSLLSQKKEKCTKTSRVRSLNRGMFSPFCILSSHLGQRHHCELLANYYETMCLPKSINLTSKGLCGTSVLC